MKNIYSLIKNINFAIIAVALMQPHIAKSDEIAIENKKVYYLIENSNSLPDLYAFLQDEDLIIRKKSLYKWQAMPINTEDLDITKKLISSKDKEVKSYAIRMYHLIRSLRRDKELNDLVLVKMESAQSVAELYDYINDKKYINYNVKACAIMRWNRLPTHDIDKPILEKLFKSDVAAIAVAKFGEKFQSDSDIQTLVELGLQDTTPAPVKVEIIKTLQKMKNEKAENGIKKMLIKSVSKKLKVELKYAYEDGDYYWVSMAAIRSLAESTNDEAKSLLKQIAEDQSVYDGLREEATVALKKQQQSISPNPDSGKANSP